MIYGSSYAFVFESRFSATVVMDPKLLRQIVTNLLSNAVKYSASGSTVTVRIAGNPTGYALQVIDEGVGIPEKDLANLFNPFYRVEQSKNQKGTGLGLTIVQEAANLCGATIAIASVVGEGSSFTIQFPHAAQLHAAKVDDNATALA
jgi:signal transduction histidine kinase